MIYYSLTDILVFLEESQFCRYTTIDGIMEILTDYHLSDSERMKYIRAYLQHHGLKELINGKDVEKELIWELPIFKDAVNPTQLFDITFTNGKIDFWQNIN